MWFESMSRDHMIVRCIYCGRFIGNKEWAADEADSEFVQPDSVFGPEIIEYWHKRCHNKEKKRHAGSAKSDA